MRQLYLKKEKEKNISIITGTINLKMAKIRSKLWASSNPY